ncbi:MAG: glycosyl-4,4'-diaponeurosporenoate acyltransferase [Acidimicrobiia bacterium]|nr:glycosyl-4,4'-diaponeurosporenoate acyltransferase [Acidimicrobiia bacterium]
MRVVHLSDPLTIVVDVIVWGLVHAGTGYAVHRLPPERLRDAWLYRRRRFETDRLYRRVLRVPRWKDRVPEAGAVFAGGMSKRHLPPGRAGGLERFVIETRRAELGHWSAAAAGPFFLLWNPWPAGVVLIAYGLVANVPCIVIQRYNRLRAERVLAARADARAVADTSGRSIP